MVKFIEFPENAGRGAGEGRRGYSAKRSSDPRVAYPAVKPSASCVYCYPLCPTGCQYSGENGFIQKPGVHDCLFVGGGAWGSPYG